MSLEELIKEAFLREPTRDELFWLLNSRYCYLKVEIVHPEVSNAGAEKNNADQLQQIIKAKSGAKDWHWPIRVYPSRVESSPGEYVEGARMEQTAQGEALYRPTGTMIQQKWSTAEKAAQVILEKGAELLARGELAKDEPLQVSFMDNDEPADLKEDLDWRLTKYAFYCAVQKYQNPPIQIVNYELNPAEEERLKKMLEIQGKLTLKPEEVAPSKPT